MIWIQSSEEDLTTNMVIDWLNYYGESWVRTNEQQISIEELSIGVKNGIILSANKTDGSKQFIDLNKIKAYWYRRGEIYFYRGKNYNEEDYLMEYLIEESKTIEEFVNFQLQRITHINNFTDNFVNKIIQLQTALKAGILIPETYIISEKKKLLDVFKIHKNLICKSLTISGIRLLNGEYFGWGTNAIDEDNIQDIAAGLDDDFFPTLIQVNVPKLFEIRAFFLNGSFWSSAILSQNDPTTKTDFRNYNTEKPNRTPPFKMPAALESALKSLIKSLNLNSGSIDLIYGQDHQYYFLEVNPIGQLWQVSYPCNYYLEKEIADFLCQKK